MIILELGKNATRISYFVSINLCKRKVFDNQTYDMKCEFIKIESSGIFSQYL